MPAQGSHHLWWAWDGNASSCNSPAGRDNTVPRESPKSSLLLMILLCVGFPREWVSFFPQEKQSFPTPSVLCQCCPKQQLD